MVVMEGLVIWRQLMERGRRIVDVEALLGSGLVG